MNENPQKFISGLAVNIGINAEKAATMVIAAIAARTRAGFLQAWVIISCILAILLMRFTCDNVRQELQNLLAIVGHALRWWLCTGKAYAR